MRWTRPGLFLESGGKIGGVFIAKLPCDILNGLVLFQEFFGDSESKPAYPLSRRTLEDLFELPFKLAQGDAESAGHTEAAETAGFGGFLPPASIVV